ncbi:Tigger transposable element-derived protein 4-like [Oopsacas minuta]|uniref:Tigger transposable element-derived protein 4-like n=1 Tax=Oopsacas minuta TaxID=111878 RepID=A0AAV7JX19_9METZ|nr:Tigger transposable element-derived protein 4-like [Oopsacas minuta]
MNPILLRVDLSLKFQMAKRNDLTLPDKIHILEKIKLQPPQSRTLRFLSDLFSIPKSTIGDCLSGREAVNTSRKRERDGKDPEIDVALNQWFKTVLHKGSKISLLDAIYFLAISWRLVKQATIANCFHKSVFGTLENVEESELIDEKRVLKEVTNGDDYLNIDKDAPCFDDSCN